MASGSVFGIRHNPTGAGGDIVSTANAIPSEKVVVFQSDECSQKRHTQQKNSGMSLWHSHLSRTTDSHKPHNEHYRYTTEGHPDPVESNPLKKEWNPDKSGRQDCELS